MAQNIILKRSALSGKVPDTGSLNLGEIAINTYDGRAFIHKSGSTESIEQIVITNSITTGSITITQTGSFGEIDVVNDINVSGSIYVTNDIVANGDLDILGSVTASAVLATTYYGDGSQLTGISAGAVDSEIPTNDWDYNLPDSGSLSDGNNQSTKYTIDFQAEGYGVRPIGYQTFITNNNGTSEIIPGTDEILFIVNNQQVGRIDAGGIVGNTPLGTISSSAQIAALGYVTSSAAASIPTGTISGSSQLTASFDTRYAPSASYLTSLNGAISSSIQVLGGSGVISSSAQIDTLFNIDGLISGSSQLTSSFEIVGVGIISGAAQLPSGLISGSSQLPTGLVSGSSQLTSSYDTRYTLSGSVSAVPAGTISGSSQLTASFDTRYALSGSGGTIPGGTISGSSQLTSSFDLRYLVTGSVTSSILQLNTFTASNANTSLNTLTSSLATTGSNSFNGTQTITGSLIVTSGSFMGTTITANTSSLYLTSGSNLYVQNNAVVEITGSLILNGNDISSSWTAYTPQWTAASSNPAINNGTIQGYYKVVGKTCFVRGNIAMGSTTTFGSGEWYVSMPFTASHADAILMTATLLDNGTAWYNASIVGARAGFNYKSAIQYQTTGGTASDVNPTAPFTWTTSDRFIWNGSYEIA